MQTQSVKYAQVVTWLVRSSTKGIDELALGWQGTEQHVVWDQVVIVHRSGRQWSVVVEYKQNNAIAMTWHSK